MKQTFSRWLQDAWYKEMYISAFFMPISMLYDDFMRFRFFLYKIGILKKIKLTVPVIVVGNITVGGTGKTPLILWLVKFLSIQGYKPGIVSRGYGGNATVWPQLVDKHSTPSLVGDEAVLMANRTNCSIAVGPKRGVAAQLLLDKTDCNIILSDDGLQHYALARDIEIAVIDGERRFGNGYMLPCGPLREPILRLRRVDLIVVNGVSEEDNEFSMQIKASIAINLITQKSKLISEFSTFSCHAIAGIGNPKRFFDLLAQQNLILECKSFPDHHKFTSEDINFADDKLIFMTEKDAVKCLDFATDKHWYIPITAQPETKFVEHLTKTLKEKNCGQKIT